MQDLKPGARIELEVEALAAGGHGIARLPVVGGRLVIFVDHGLPGEVARVEITGIKAGRAEARRLETLRRSPDEAAPECPHFGDCGGCSWQDLDYAAQLAWKRRLAADNLRRLAAGADSLVAACEPSPAPYGFRNKMEFAFAGAGAGLKLGLRRKASAQVVEVPGCRLMAAPAMEIVRLVREACAHSGLGTYEPAQETAARSRGGRPGRKEKAGGGRGAWRFLVLRRNLAGEFTVEIITGPEERSHAAVAKMAGELLEAEPAVRSVVHSVRSDPAAVAYGEMIVQSLGPASMGRLEEKVGDELYYLSPGAFFQTNTLAAARLAEVVDELAGPGSLGTVFDIYGGSGLLSRKLALRAGAVVVFESSARAVADGQDAARASGLERVEFRHGPASSSLGRAEEIPDLAIVDPPRAGLDPGVMKRLLRLCPPRIAYVSCHPASQARDLRELCGPYELASVRPVDLFPHSPHVETAALLVRKS